jgi:hypothetical protein
MMASRQIGTSIADGGTMSAHRTLVAVAWSMVVLTVGACIASARPQAAVQDDRRIWVEFVALLKAGRVTGANLRPTYVPTATMLEFLDAFRKNASWNEWEREPETFRAGDSVHFVIDLNEGVTKPGQFSFSFLVESGHWYLQHLEGIVVRLDRLGGLPAATFPDLPEDRKAWMREEIYWSQMVRLLGERRKTDGLPRALSMFHDGAGFQVAARTWLPFVAPSRAFILYACWEQSRLRGNTVTLERLDEARAVVVVDSIYLDLYVRTGHLRDQISEEDYRQIFETIWRDRADAAGWKVAFDYGRTPRVTLRFER